MWLLLNISNTVITLFSIVILFQKVNKLKENSTSISFNWWTMIIHIFLLVTQCFVVGIYMAPKSWFRYDAVYQNTTFAVVIINWMVQMTISWICYSQASIQRRYNFRMTELDDGRLTMQFSKRGSIVIVDDAGCDEIMQQFVTGLDSEYANQDFVYVGDNHEVVEPKHANTFTDLPVNDGLLQHQTETDFGKPTRE